MFENFKIFVFFAGLSFFAGCKENVQTSSLTFSGLGTVLNVIYTGEKNEEVESALKFDVEKVESEFSYYRKDSFIAILNRDAFLKEVSVPIHVCRLIQQSLEFGKESEGVFDITYKSEGLLWEKDKNKEPSEKELREKKEMVGYDRVSTDCEKGAVRFLKDGVKIDLGGIAKGYAIDRAGAILKEKGISNFIINYGGDMLVCGRKGEKSWTVGIKNPDSKSDYLKTLNFGNNECTGVATSGDYERFFVVDKQTYSHIFDPRTGRPVKNARSVTVVAENATVADVFATAVSVGIGEEVLIKKFMEKFKVKIYTLSGPDMKWKEW